MHPDDALSRSRGRRLWATAVAAFSAPPALALWGGALGLITFFDDSMVSPALVGAGAGLVQAGLFAHAWRSPRFTRGVLGLLHVREVRRRLQQVTEDVARLDGRTRERAAAVLADFDAIQAAGKSKNLPGYARVLVDEVFRELVPLAARTGDLAKRRGELMTLLDGVNRPALFGQQAQLRTRLDQARRHDDSVEAAQLEQALRFKTDEADAYAAIEQAVRRIDGQLENVVCAFAALKARVLRLQSEDPQAAAPTAEATGAALHDELETVRRQMDVLDKSAREALTLRCGSTGA